MAKFSRDLKAELVEAQLAAQHWEEKYIAAVTELNARAAVSSRTNGRHAQEVEALRAELGQCSRELQACSASLDECRRERGEALARVLRGVQDVAERDDCPHSINYALSEVFELAGAGAPEADTNAMLTGQLQQSRETVASLQEKLRECRHIERALRSSNANQLILAAIDAVESARLVSGSCESAWAKQVLAALRGDGQ